MEVQVNYLAVLLAAIANMVVGAGWYAGPVFGDAWMKMVKLDKDKAAKGAPLALGGAFVLALVMAYGLSYFAAIMQQYFLGAFFTAAIQTGFLLWVGIAVPTLVTHGLFEQRRKKLLVMTAAHELVSIMVMSVIIGAVGW